MPGLKPSRLVPKEDVVSDLYIEVKSGLFEISNLKFPYKSTLFHLKSILSDCLTANSSLSFGKINSRLAGSLISNLDVE